MKKLLSIALAITTIAWLGAAYVPVAKAAVVVDGDIVSATAAFIDADGNAYQAYDVFIVKIMGSKIFKRLILNPQVFTSYGHLKWSNLKKISVDTIKTYSTSALVRVINDEKVYRLMPDGDVGTKQWVDDLACFNSKGYDWDSVYTINAVDGGNYTTGGNICGTNPVVNENLNLSLASDNPVSSTLPPNAQGVTFLKVNVGGTGTVNQVTISRQGAGSIDDFDDIYIYKNGVRLTSGRTLSASNSKVTFINLGIVAPATFEVVANMSATTGNVNYLAIQSASDITANGTVGGNFPINGNPMGVSGTSAGTLVLEKSGAATRDVLVGQTNTEISQFKLTTATEAAHLYRVRLFNSGTATNSLITNLKLQDNAGNTLATTGSISNSGYADFVLATPFAIKKGESQIFRVFADIGAVKPAQTIILYAELATDILAKGDVYGYGMPATLTSLISGNTITVTTKGGDLTLNKIGPNASNIGKTTSDTVFLEFSMSAAANITIKRTRLAFMLDKTGLGASWDAITSAGPGIEDIKVKDKDSGVVVIGPKDGTAFNDATTTVGAAAAVYEDFTDTLDLIAGQTKTYQITADVKADSSNGDITTNTVMAFALKSYADLVTTSGNLNYMKYADTTEAVLGTAIAPSGDIVGPNMTVQASSLTVTLAATPSGSSAAGTFKTYIKGQSGVDAVGIAFSAGSASSATINNITLTAYTSENTGTRVGKWAAGVDTNYVKDSIGSVYIYDKTTGALIPGSTAKGFSGTNSSLVEFTGLHWTIPAGETRTLLVKTDISSASPASASTADTFIAFDITTPSSDISAVDGDGNTITLVSTTPNGGSTTNASVAPVTDFGIASYGSLAVVAASDTPDRAIAVMGTSDNAVSKFKLTGTSEGFNIEKFSVVLADGDTGADSKNSDNFTAVKLQYQTQAQWGTSNWTITDGKTFQNTASLAFSFTGTNRPYVPKDDNAYISVLTSINGYLGGQGASSKVPFKIYTIAGSADSFTAYGAQSGQLLTTFTEPASTGFSLQFVARSKPVFAKETWSGAELELARFSITAVGGDVVFTGTDDNVAGELGSADLRFDIVASSTDDASGALILYDWNENIISSASAVTWGAGLGTSVSFGFEVRNTTVPSGTTKVFHADLSGADLGDFQKTDEYIYLQLKNDKGGDTATGAYTGDVDQLSTQSFSNDGYNIVFDDATLGEGISGIGSPEKRFGVPALIKNIGPLPLTFRTLRGTATP